MVCVEIWLGITLARAAEGHWFWLIKVSDKLSWKYIMNMGKVRSHTQKRRHGSKSRVGKYQNRHEWHRQGREYRVPGDPKRTKPWGLPLSWSRWAKCQLRAEEQSKQEQENQESTVSENQENTDFLKLRKDKHCPVVCCQVENKREKAEIGQLGSHW